MCYTLDMPAAGSFDLSAHKDGVWNLKEFVAVANGLLPHYLPKDASGRSSEEVNARLIRHYATQGLLAEARKEGREARYVFGHLLQLLVVRKLLADGFSAAAIRKVIDGRTNRELENLLQGSVRVDLVPEAGRADVAQRAQFLKGIRAKAGLDAAPAPAATPVPGVRPGGSSVDSLFSPSQWTRMTILDGLDLFVRDDFELPKNRLGDAQLTQLLQVVLLQLEQRRKGRS